MSLVHSHHPHLYIAFLLRSVCAGVYKFVAVIFIFKLRFCQLISLLQDACPSTFINLDLITLTMFLWTHCHTSIGLLASLKNIVRADINTKTTNICKKVDCSWQRPVCKWDVVESGATHPIVEAWQVTVASSDLSTNLSEEEAHPWWSGRNRFCFF